MQEGIVRTERGRLAYVERGEPDGLSVFYHHGTPGSRIERHPDPDVYRGVRFVAHDRPGYGRSERQAGRTVASVAADVAAIADALAIERFAVLGISGGGPHALACAALLPERVTRVAVLVGAAPADDPDLDFLAGMTDLNVNEFSAAARSEGALAALLEPFVHGIEKDPDAVIDEIAAELPEPDQALVARPEVRAVLRESFVESVRQGARGWIDDDLAFVAPWGFGLERVRAEVRLWQGELDVLVPRSHGEYLAARLPTATFELVPNPGHLLFDQEASAPAWLGGSGDSP